MVDVSGLIRNESMIIPTQFSLKWKRHAAIKHAIRTCLIYGNGF